MKLIVAKNQTPKSMRPENVFLMKFLLILLQKFFFGQ